MSAPPITTIAATDLTPVTLDHNTRSYGGGASCSCGWVGVDADIHVWRVAVRALTVLTHLRALATPAPGNPRLSRYGWEREVLRLTGGGE